MLYEVITFVIEMPVNSAPADTGAGRDLYQAGLGNSLFRKEYQACFDDGLPSQFGLCFRAFQRKGLISSQVIVYKLRVRSILYISYNFV